MLKWLRSIQVIFSALPPHISHRKFGWLRTPLIAAFAVAGCGAWRLLALGVTKASRGELKKARQNEFRSLGCWITIVDFVQAVAHHRYSETCNWQFGLVLRWTKPLRSNSGGRTPTGSSGWTCRRCRLRKFNGSGASCVVMGGVELTKRRKLPVANFMTDAAQIGCGSR